MTPHIYFIWKRLHSLMGIVPVGFFLIWHLAVNSFALKGPEAYNANVEFLRSLPFLLAIELTFILGPIAAHGILGLIITREGEINLGRNLYLRNLMYVFQRITGIILLAFVTFHVWTLRFAHHPENVNFFSLFQEMFKNWYMLLVYSIGLLSAIFHFCNGISTFCIVWGITAGPLSQRVVGMCCVMLGIVLSVIGFAAVYAFLSTPFYTGI